MATINHHNGVNVNTLIGEGLGTARTRPAGGYAPRNSPGRSATGQPCACNWWRGLKRKRNQQFLPCVGAGKAAAHLSSFSPLMHGGYDNKDGEFPVWKDYHLPYCDHMLGNVDVATTSSPKDMQPSGVWVGGVT